MLYLKNCHSVLIVNSRLLHASTLELSVSVNGLYCVLNTCSMLYLKNCHSVLIVSSGIFQMLNASTLELSFNVNGLFRILKKYFISRIVSQC